MISKVDIVALVTLGVFEIGHSGESPSAQNDFDEALIDGANYFLIKFGESVTYFPVGSIGDAVVGSGDILSMATLGIFRQDESGREITAIIERGQPTGLDGAPHGQAPLLTIEAANDAETGISSSEVDTGGDTVELPVRVGQTEQPRRITKILHQDAGMIKLELR